MPYIEQLSANRIKKVTPDNEILQTRRLKSTSQIFRISEDNLDKITVTKFTVENPWIYKNGLKLVNIQYKISGQDIEIPFLDDGDIIEVIQTIDKPDSIEYFPLYYTEHLNANKKVFILPWTYNSSLGNITIYKNGILTDRSEYTCPQDDIVEFNEEVQSGVRVTFFSAIPTVAGDLYGEYFNTYPILGKIDYYGDFPPPGYVELNGEELYRSEYPDAWIRISESAISDNEWLSDSENQYKFSSGNGVSTFRVPNEKSENPNCIRCIKLNNTIINSTAADVYGIQKELRTVTERFDNRSFSRNLLINGSCAVNTRGNLAKGTGIDYCLDRWMIRRSLAEASVEQIKELEGKTTSRYYMRVSTYSSQDDEEKGSILLRYNVENIFQFSNKKFTFSMMGRCDKKNPIYLGININFGNSGSPAILNTLGQVLSINETWSRVGYTFKVPDISMYQVDTTGGRLELNLWLSADVSILEANGIGERTSVFDFTDFQLEEGEIMTGVEVVPTSLEYSLCQFYCRKYKEKHDTEELSWTMKSVPIEVSKGDYYIYDAETY